MELVQGIAVWDNTFLRNEELIDGAEKGIWSDASLDGLRKCVKQSLEPNSPIYPELVQLFIFYINQYGKHYSHLKINGSEGLKVFKYNTGDFYNEHIDTTYDKKISNRQLSAVLCLNDDFKGGNLLFPKQEVEIELKAGRLVLYPSSFTHVCQIEEVTDRACYMLKSFFR